MSPAPPNSDKAAAAVIGEDISERAASPPSFGIVAEGPCDIAVIRHLLAGYLADPDVDLRALEPKPGELGGWTVVIRYCASDDFRRAFDFVGHIIVHIDTDVCDHAGYDVRRQAPDGRPLTPHELVAAVRERLVRAIGPDFYARHADRIVFAIAVDATECWLLPAAFPDKPGKAAKTTNCLGALNDVLTKKAGFSIDASRKQERYFHKTLKTLDRNRKLHRMADNNPSLDAFVQALHAAVPTTPRPTDDH